MGIRRHHRARSMERQRPGPHHPHLRHLESALIERGARPGAGADDRRGPLLRRRCARPGDAMSVVRLAPSALVVTALWGALAWATPDPLPNSLRQCAAEQDA